MKKLLVFALIILGFASVARGQDGARSKTFRAVGTTTPINLINTAIGFHKITWNVVGTASVCTVALDTSADGITWSAGGAITGQTCTSNGSSTVVNVASNFVRINITALTLTAGSSVTITWDGWVINPAGGGGNISCNIAGAVAFETATDTLGCDADLDYVASSKTLFAKTYTADETNDTNSGITVGNLAAPAGNIFAVTLLNTGALQMFHRPDADGTHQSQLTFEADGSMQLFPGTNDPGVQVVGFLQIGKYAELAGSTSGAARIQVAAVAGTPNPLQLPTATGTNGQALITDGGNPQQLSWSTLTGTGTVTSIATSAPISGGTITGAGTISCPTCAIGPGSSTNHGLASWNGTGGLTLESLDTQFTISATTLTAGSTGVLDLSAAPVTAGLKIPSAAGAVPTADGFIGTNTTTHTYVWGSNGTTEVGAVAATGTGTATTCTDKFVTTISSLVAPTCTTPTLASAQFANQGTTTTLVHGNSSGNPSFGAVVSADMNITTTTCTNQFLTAIGATGTGTCTTDTLASAQHANQGTTTTVLHGNGAGNPAFGAVVTADLNITTTTCTNQVVSAISAGAAGTCHTVVGGDMASNTVTATQLAAQYSKWQGCGSRGLGDGLNAITAGTYLQFACVNDTGVTVTITGIHCWTDNAGTSSLNAANNAATALLTGAVTCNATKASGGAAGSQSGTTTLANGDAISFTFVADGTSKQTNWTVSGTL